MEDLIKKAKSGDKLAFTELMLQMQDELYKIAKIRLKNDDDVFDVIQDTMLSAYKSLKKLKHNEYKREDSYETVGSTLVSPDKTEEQINFKFICDKLSEEDGTIILLYYMEKYTDREIGEILNMKENTVRTKRNRIKNKIKKFYEEYNRYSWTIW